MGPRLHMVGPALKAGKRQPNKMLVEANGMRGVGEGCGGEWKKRKVGRARSERECLHEGEKLTIPVPPTVTR